mmetsp:Transcript_6229/g.13626  ORF Transcript_6229/g.13626 Transcript_6229/m.13626 type:complete len:285 (+) Transcript_6229:450-1304(+)
MATSRSQLPAAIALLALVFSCVASAASSATSRNFVEFSNQQVAKIIKDLAAYPDALAAVNQYRNIPLVKIFLSELPPMYAANLNIMTVAYPLTTFTITANNNQTRAAFATMYQTAMRLHLAHGQGMAAEALGFQAYRINKVMWYQYRYYQTVWDLGKRETYQSLNFTAYANLIEKDWAQLVSWARTYTNTSASPFNVPTPFVLLLSNPNFDPWLKTLITLDWEKHYWEVKSGLLRNQEQHRLLTTYVYWHWTSLFQGLILRDQAAVVGDLVRSFAPFMSFVRFA